MKILMLHGINHNLFGQRDPVQCGTVTLDEIKASLAALGQELGADIVNGQVCGFGVDSYLLALRAGVSAAKAAKVACA